MKLKSKIIGFSSLVLIPVATTSVLISCSNQADMEKNVMAKLKDLQTKHAEYLTTQVTKLNQHVQELTNKISELGTKYLKDKKSQRENFDALVALYKKIKDDKEYEHKDLNNRDVKIAVVSTEKLTYKNDLVQDQANFKEIERAINSFCGNLNTLAKNLRTKVDELNQKVQELEKEIEDGKNSIDNAKSLIDFLNDSLNKVTTSDFQEVVDVSNFAQKLGFDGVKEITLTIAQFKTKTINQAFEEVQKLENENLLAKFGITPTPVVKGDKVTVTYKVNADKSKGIKIDISIKSSTKATIKNERNSYLIIGFKA